MNTIGKKACLLGLSLLSLSIAAHAAGTEATSQHQDAAEKLTLETMQVVENRLTNTNVTITREDLQRHQAQDMADVFANQPSVSVGGGARNAQRIYVRGLEASNLNVSIDGATQGRNLHQHRGNIGSMDPALLKQVEVQTGFSADSGPGALGGSIRFETVDAQDLLRSGQQQGLTLRSGYASVDDAVRGGATVYGLLSDEMGLMGHVNAINRNDYEVGSGGKHSYAPNSAGQDRDYMLKLSLLDKNDHSLRIGASHSRNTGLYLYGREGSDAGYAPEGSVAQRQRTERTTYTLDHRYKPTDNPLLDLKTNLYSNHNELHNFDSGSLVESKGFGGSIRNIFEFNLGQLNNQLTVGGDYMHEKGEQKGGRVDSTSHNLGLFVQNRMQYGRFMLSAGVRYDDFKTEFGSYDMDGDEISPNINVVIDLGYGFELLAGYGEAVRSSGVIPIGWMSNFQPNTSPGVINHGRALKPEESSSREIGLSFKRNGLLFADDRFSASLTYFDTRIDNLIEWQGGGMSAANAYNLNETYRTKGADLRLNWGMAGFETSLGYMHADLTLGGKDAAAQRRRGAPQGDRFVWDNRWQVTPEISLGYTLNAVTRMDDVPAGGKERPGYALHSIQAQWQPAAISGLDLALLVSNLGDKRYSEQTSIASGDNILDEPGRDIRVTATYRF